MKGKFLVLAFAALASGAKADITVNVNPATGMTEYAAEYAYINDVVKPRMERPAPNRVSGTLTNGSFILPLLADGAARYIIPTGDNEYIMLFALPGEELTVTINSTNPLSYEVAGSKMMEEIAAMDKEAGKLTQQFRELQASGEADRSAAEEIEKAYGKIFADYLLSNPAGAAAGYAIMHLEGEEFLKAFDAMTPAVKESLFYPILVQQHAYELRAAEAARRHAELESGKIEAPNFTFNDVNGKPVSLSDFRGKWVVIDFWGSWCPWCIKGFPKLKEAYAQYKPELEIIGIDCKDPKDKWETALKKYELPWVNVYNPDPEGGQVLKDYAVEGFPTKAIVNPEGKIVNITVGEDPSFFDVLAKFIKK